MIIHGSPFPSGSYSWVSFRHKKRDVLKRYLKRFGAVHQCTKQYNSQRSWTYRFKDNFDYARIFYNECFACWELHLSNEQVYKRVMKALA